MYTMLHSTLVKANNNLSPKQPYLPLWIMCDGQDPERTALIGCEPVQTSSNQDANSQTSFVVTTVTCEGLSFFVFSWIWVIFSENIVISNNKMYDSFSRGLTAHMYIYKFHSV